MKTRVGICAGACALLIALDRLSKVWATRVLKGQLDGEMPVWNGVFHFHYAENTGAAFGLFSGLRGLNVALTFLLVLAVGMAIWHFREKRGVLASGAFLMAGGISHLYDRLTAVSIVDFIEIDFVRFAIFNVADICVCLGALGLACTYIFQEYRTRGKNT